jgi:para-aminobenzoate synthetase
LTIDPPVVISKDATTTSSFLDAFDGIILSPGPGSPQEQPPLSHDAILRMPHKPLLGVCLGHQLLALAYGARVDCAPQPIHGQDHWIATTTVVQQQKELELTNTHLQHSPTHNNNNTNRPSTTDTHTTLSSSRSPLPLYPSLFQDLPSTFRVVRYHSLCAYQIPTENLVVTACSQPDHVIQAIQHVQYPHYGVQFHPESIGTQWGMELLTNFVKIVDQHKHRPSKPTTITTTEKLSSASTYQQTTWGVTTPTTKSKADSIESRTIPSSSTLPRFRVMMYRLVSKTTKSDVMVQPEQVFARYYAHQRYSMWLDSSSYPSRGELDILAAPIRPNDILEYHQGLDKKDILTLLQEELSGHKYNHSPRTSTIGWIKTIPSCPRQKQLGQSPLDDNLVEWIDESSPASSTIQGKVPPFHYRGGYLGFLGYEIRHDTQRFLHPQQPKHQQQPQNDDPTSTPTDEKPTKVPTAAFFLARQSMVYHHPTESWYLIGLVEDDTDIDDNLDWMNSVIQDFATWTDTIEESNEKAKGIAPSKRNSRGVPLQFIPNRTKQTYQQDIADCHEYIHKGDSYELCLTNQLEVQVEKSTTQQPRPIFDLYKRLRCRNPAPYSAYFRWNVASEKNNDDGKRIDVLHSSSLVICSSSPERTHQGDLRSCTPPKWYQSYRCRSKGRRKEGSIVGVVTQKSCREPHDCRFATQRLESCMSGWVGPCSQTHGY